MSYSFDPNRGLGGGSAARGSNYDSGRDAGQDQDDQEPQGYPQQSNYPGQRYSQPSYPQQGAYPGPSAGRLGGQGYAGSGYARSYPQSSDTEAPTSPSAPVYTPAGTTGSNLRTFLIVGVVLVVLVCCVLPAAILLRNQAGQTTTQPTPAPGQVVYQTTFTVPDDRWPSSNGCAFQNDGYHITNNATCIARINAPNDLSIAATVVQTSGATNLPHGIALRRTSANDYYVFGITGAGSWAFVKYADNKSPQMLAGFTASTAIKTGLNMANTIEVRAKGGHFDFYVNGTKVGQHDDGSYTSGLPGLSGNSDATVVYTNFKLSKLAGE